MVEPIGTKAGGAVTDRRTASVGAAGSASVAASGAVGALDKVAALRPVANDGPAVQSVAADLSSEMAARPPVDADRIARIRKAIQEKRFPVYPADIADRLLAYKLEWKPNDPA